jgi:hypothetical protein
VHARRARVEHGRPAEAGQRGLELPEPPPGAGDGPHGVGVARRGARGRLELGQRARVVVAHRR